MKRSALILLSLIPTPLLAQDSCAALTINSVQYHPFTDTAIVVQVENASAELFDYPGFVLINSIGDTLAQEHVNFFGIGQQSTHYLSVNPGVADPMDIFNGSLELHTNFYDTLACSWPLNESLCITEPCSDIVIGLQNWGGALVMGNFEWELLDSVGMTVDSGSLTMVDTVQYWFHTICAPPGSYTYNLEALTPPTGGGPHITVAESEIYGGAFISQPLDWFNNPTASLSFPFYLHCATSPNNIQQEMKGAFKVATIGKDLQASGLSGFKTLELINTLGQLVASFSITSDRQIISSSIPTGTYVLIARGENGRIASQKVIKP